MTDTIDTHSHGKANGAFFPISHGLEVRGVQQRLLSSLMRQPDLVSTVSTTGIKQEDFPAEWQHAFYLATKEPGRIRQIVADRNGDPTIKQLYNQIVLLGHGQARQMAEQIVARVRGRDNAQHQSNDHSKEYSTDGDSFTKRAAESERQQDDNGPNADDATSIRRPESNEQKSNSEDKKADKKERIRFGFWLLHAADITPKRVDSIWTDRKGGTRLARGEHTLIAGAPQVLARVKLRSQ
jgi:hypothetical protein